MCLAVPLKVLQIGNGMATVDLYGARREGSLLILPEEVAVGDSVLVHAGFAMRRVDETAALETLDLLKAMSLLPAEESI
jgi:hydrogenase expression/formation protein HypC